MTAAPARIVIDDRSLTVAELVAIARGAPVALGPAARGRIEASRAVVDRLAGGEALIYGLNTGLGNLRDERIPSEAIEAMQPMLVRGHAGGIGPPLPTEVVRAAMAVRIAGIARGGSGASPAVADTFVAMLDAGVHPRVPTVGSVGAADLMHMAAIALVAMGEGRAELDGVDMTGAEALARAGIEPVRLGVKDALTVMSANGVSIGHGALVVNCAARVIELAELAAAVSFEAAGANLSVIEPAVAAAKPVTGQAVSAARIRDWLEGSGLCADGAAVSVQDPLSFRVVPQVHGATREVIRFATEAVEAELGAMDDNPLVSIETGTMTSNGNFHPMLLALAIDALRPALAHVGQLADRRMGNLWDRIAADPASFTPENLERMGRYGSPLLRYSGAARSAELTSLAGPVTLDIAPLDVGVEDHATNAPLAVRRTADALAALEDVLAVEVLTATAVIALRDDGIAAMAPATTMALEVVTRTIEELAKDAPAGDVHALVTARLMDLVAGRIAPTGA